MTDGKVCVWSCCLCIEVLNACVFTEAVNNIISFLGMQPCERSDKVPENKNSHVLFLGGKCSSSVSIPLLVIM